MKVEVVVDSGELRTVLDAICRSAKTGQVGDGKIFVSDLSDVIRIRTHAPERHHLIRRIPEVETPR